jgi:hypothetical protein
MEKQAHHEKGHFHCLRTVLLDTGIGVYEIDQIRVQSRNQWKRQLFVSRPT